MREEEPPAALPILVLPCGPARPRPLPVRLRRALSRGSGLDSEASSFFFRSSPSCCISQHEISSIESWTEEVARRPSPAPPPPPSAPLLLPRYVSSLYSLDPSLCKQLAALLIWFLGATEIPTEEVLVELEFPYLFF